MVVLQVLLKRGTTKDGFFLHVPSGSFDHDLFTLIWGPTVAALSFVFDKSSDESIIQKAIAGFRYVQLYIHVYTFCYSHISVPV